MVVAHPHQILLPKTIFGHFILYIPLDIKNIYHHGKDKRTKHVDMPKAKSFNSPFCPLCTEFHSPWSVDSFMQGYLTINSPTHPICFSFHSANSENDDNSVPVRKHISQILCILNINIVKIEHCFTIIHKKLGMFLLWAKK